MKKLFIFALLLLSTNLYTKDFHKTEEMINSILNEESEPASKGENNQKDSTPISGETTEINQNGNESKPGNQSEEQTEEISKKPVMTGNDEILLKTGIQLYESGLYDNSLIRFNDIIKNFPNSKFIDSARMWAGKIYIRKYDYDNALIQFNNVGEKSGEYPASLFYRGESLRIKGDSIGAIENYQKVSSSYPENEIADNAILITGKLYLANGKGYQALESALRIIRYYKNTESIDDAYYLIAKIYEKDPILKDIELARKFYRVFLKKSDSKQKFFSDSPLIGIVKKDLEFLDKTYFKLER
ncbi:MAG TPA: tetratricopeptide repeat protein [Spirochaetota bacterium]|nr:tetratricopeptide repeat protein [Spirochaetota bacterium]HPF04618.1 tetratricopeptide repeat protein [Spirochaetota bacterium]HPJ42027.1 tetratricopeptide repeat protein [Spirochaetota bacterium]HPR36181.1 tetratricopeptide repeat protein [Spirochaetota bacterium]HRX46140.1 tetratricopeptide repeat protein [Spirochaetota bacterium]